MNVTLYGNVFADVIKLGILRQGAYLGGPQMPSQVCHKREAEGHLTDRSRGGNVKTEVETGVMWTQAKECQ